MNRPGWSGKLAGARAVAAEAAEAHRRASGALAAALGSRPGIDVVIPRTTIAGWMTLVGRADTSRIRAEANAHFAAAGYSAEQLAAKTSDLFHDWNAEIAVRTLALAVRDPAEHDKALDSLEAWRENIDDEQIASLWRAHQELVEREDPIGSDTAALTDHELVQLESAAKKKDFDLLMSFGLRKLAIFATTSVAAPAS